MILNQSRLIPFLNDVSWWPDKRLVDSVKALDSVNRALVVNYGSVESQNGHLKKTINNYLGNTDHYPFQRPEKTIYPYQHVKKNSSIIFGELEVHVNGFDSKLETVYVHLRKLGHSNKRDSSITNNFKISVDNPCGFPMGNAYYAVYLDSIRFGYPTDPKTPAAFIRVVSVRQ